MKRVRLASARRADDGRQISDMTRDPAADLQRLIVRPGAALGCRPVDDLVRILDVAGLAVDAVGCVDLQAFASLWILYGLVDVCRAEALAGVAELLRAAVDTDIRIEHLEVGRLIFIMRGRCEEDRRQAIARR